MTTKRAILLVEDDEDDVFLMERALQGADVINPLYVVEDGQEALDYLAGAGKFSDRASYPVPAIVFLDLKLPLKSGHEVLAWIRQQKEFESLVVVVLTSSNEPSDLSRSYKLGANSYLVKPLGFDALVSLVRSINTVWLAGIRNSPA